MIVRGLRALQLLVSSTGSSRVQPSKKTTFALQLRASSLTLVVRPGERTDLDSESDDESIIATTSPLATAFRCVAYKRDALVCLSSARTAKKWGPCAYLPLHGHVWVSPPVAERCMRGG